MRKRRRSGSAAMVQTHRASAGPKAMKLHPMNTAAVMAEEPGPDPDTPPSKAHRCHRPLLGWSPNQGRGLPLALRAPGHWLGSGS
ncbi:acyl-CoA synthetase [Platysternon megacephalum]|uniref:Acyl-CoA synthetase n=1 Tax=Platysternon megacephalum TaxID=55544 RepID=A0A4D9DIY6_9SAUR|nr:acyl-CoA synthetase [Platysternon megacephalum]